MIDLQIKVSLKVGDPNKPQTENTNQSGWLVSRFKRFYEFSSDLIEFLINDDPDNYRITYDDGYDAYMIMYGKEFSEGFYSNSMNPNEWMYKTKDEYGYPIAAFHIPSNYSMDTVKRMEGLEMAPTDTLDCISVAEIYITNCDESNLDPFIPLRISYNGRGEGYVWYGRNSKYELDRENFNKNDITYDMEIQSINEWLKNNPDEEPDVIDLTMINQINEINKASTRVRKRSDNVQ